MLQRNARYYCKILNKNPNDPFNYGSCGQNTLAFINAVNNVYYYAKIVKFKRSTYLVSTCQNKVAHLVKLFD